MRDRCQARRRGHLRGARNRISIHDIQAGVIRTIVLCPPGEATSANDILEYETDNTPCDIVDS